MSKLEVNPRLFQYLFVVALLSAIIGLLGDSLIGRIGLIIFSVILLVTVVYRPRYGLYFLSFAMPIESMDVIALNISYFKILGIAIFLGWLLKMRTSRSKRIFVSSEMFFAFALVILGFLSYFWANFYKLVAIQRSVTLLLFVGFFCLIGQIITSKKDLEYLIASNLFGSFILLLVGSYAALSFIFGIDVGEKIFGFNLALFGVHMALPAFFLWMKVLAAPNLKHKLSRSILLGFVLFITSILSPISFSIITIILFIGALKAILKKHYKRGAIYSALIVLIFSISLLLSPTNLGDVNESLDFDATADKWNALSPNFKDSPVFGIGLGNSNYFHHGSNDDTNKIILSSASIFQDVRTEPHIYIEFLIELGIVGLLIFIYFLLGMIKKGIVLITHLPPAGSSWLIGATIFSYFLFIISIDLFQPIIHRKMLWFALALMMVSGRIFMQELNENKN